MTTLVIFLVSIFLIIRYKCFQVLQPPLPPGPKPLPYLRSLIGMIQNKPTFRGIQRMMEEMNTNILCICIGKVHVIVVSDPKIARELLKDKDRIFASRPDYMSAYLASSGYSDTVFAPMSNHWKTMRRILATKILSGATHKWLQNKRDQEANNLISYIYNKCETIDGVVNVRDIAIQYASNTLRNIVFGSRSFGKGNGCGGREEGDVEHDDFIFTILDHIYAFCVTDYFPWLRWITDFDGHERIMRNALRKVKKYQHPLIDKRIQQWRDGSRTEEDDLLDIFINLENPKLTPNQIKAQILDLMIAGFDNTSNNVEWTIAEMINQPRIFKKAIMELDYVVGKDRLVQESDLVNLNYIKSCIRESFRLHPVESFSPPHVASTDTIVAGYLIPRGSPVILSRTGLGRNPEVWDDPLTFNPDRHLNGDQEVVLTDHNLHMFSFGTGRRGCPGVLLGSTLTVMLLARLLQGFTWELPPDEPSVDLTENLQNLWKAKPLLALAKPRLPHHLYHMR